MTLIQVAGGTGAGRRRVKQPQPQHSWVHECDRLVPGATVNASLSPRYRRCPHCGTGRPS